MSQLQKNAYLQHVHKTSLTQKKTSLTQKKKPVNFVNAGNEIEISFWSTVYTNKQTQITRKTLGEKVKN